MLIFLTYDQYLYLLPFLMRHIYIVVQKIKMSNLSSNSMQLKKKNKTMLLFWFRFLTLDPYLQPQHLNRMWLNIIQTTNPLITRHFPIVITVQDNEVKNQFGTQEDEESRSKNLWRHKNEGWGEEERERKPLKKRWIISHFYDVTCWFFSNFISSLIGSLLVY